MWGLGWRSRSPQRDNTHRVLWVGRVAEADHSALEGGSQLEARVFQCLHNETARSIEGIRPGAHPLCVFKRVRPVQCILTVLFTAREWV